MVINPTADSFSAESFRSQMPIAERYVYLDHAAVSPLSRPALEAMQTFVSQATTEGDTCWPTWARGLETGRSYAAELIDCLPSEIAMIPNTTYGINIVAHGWRWRPGENVVVAANEFPSNLLPWRLLQERGVEVRCIEGKEDELIDRLIAAVDQKTRITTLSWVHYLSGYRADLARVGEEVHRRGSLFMVDAIQGLGAFPLSVRSLPIDFLAADGHKWMLGPEGAGLLYIRQEHLDSLQPIMAGWGSVAASHRFDPNQTELKSTAARFEGGSANMVGQLGLAASLRMLLDLGCQKTESRLSQAILDQTKYLVEKLQSIKAITTRHSQPSRQSGIVAFTLPDHDSSLVRERLLKRNIVVSVRHGHLRTAVHAYNTHRDIDFLIEALSTI
jgi:cysteine desulfurase / selenocysteine lyase